MNQSVNQLDNPISAISGTNKAPIISVRNLNKTYKLHSQKVIALDTIDLDVYSGEFIAIMGASGSGKSTLLQLIGGLDKPTSGSITVKGALIDKLSDGELSRFRNMSIGFVFQSFYLQPFLNLERNIEVAAMPNRMSKAERKVRMSSLATRTGLLDRLKHLPRELSGGQIQRAAIARALINHPEIIIADEPTGNLDSSNSANIMSLFQSIRDELGTTIVIATHDSEIAAKADRVITIKDGVIQ